VQITLKNMFGIIGSNLSLTYFGNNYSLQMVRQCGLHIISKLRCEWLTVNENH